MGYGLCGAYLMYMKKLYLLFIIGSAFLQVKAQQVPFPDLLNQGKYQEIISEAQELLAKDSAKKIAWLYKGLAQKELYKYQPALKTFEQALKSTHDSLLFMPQLAKAYELSGNIDKAKQTYLELIEKDSLNTNARVNLAQIYKSENEYVKAMGEYSTLVKNDTTTGYFLSQLAWCCHKAGFHPPVINYYLKAIELNLNDVESKKKLVNFAVTTKDYDTALVFIDTFLQQHPDNIYLLKQKGYTQGLSGNYLDAVHTFKQVVELGDTSLFTAKYFGQSLYNNGQYDDAVKWLSIYLDKKPDDAKNQFIRAMAWRNDYQYANSIDGFNKTLDLVYDKELISLVFREFAQAYYKYGDYLGFRDSTGTKSVVKYNLARDAYLEAEKINPEKHEIYKELGVLYEYKYKDLKLALYYYEKYYQKVDASKLEEHQLEWIQSKITQLKEELHFMTDQ